MRSCNYSGLESISSRALHFSCDKLIPPNLINFLDLPEPLSMKTLSLYVQRHTEQWYQHLLMVILLEHFSHCYWEIFNGMGYKLCIDFFMVWQKYFELKYFNNIKLSANFFSRNYNLFTMEKVYLKELIFANLVQNRLSCPHGARVTKWV